MRLATLWSTIVAGAALASACNDSLSPGQEFSNARKRWAAQGPSSYQLTVVRSCECTDEMTGPVVVTVQKGSVVSRTYTSNSANVAPSLEDAFPSVDGLFAVIEEAMRQGVFNLEVSYHPGLGYPQSIYIDSHSPTVDDEISTTVTNFAPQEER